MDQDGVTRLVERVTYLEGRSISYLAQVAHANARAKGFYAEDEAVEATKVGERIALMHSELSEAFEEYRKSGVEGLRTIYFESATNPKPEGFPIELADLFIRLVDFCAWARIDLEAAIVQKMAFNATRPFRHGGKRA